MKRVVNGGWRIILATLCLALGVAAGSAWVLAADTAPPAAAPDAKAQAIEHFKNAKALFDQEKYPEAAAENDIALSLDPTLLDAKLLQKILAAKIGTAPTTEPATTGTASSSKIQILTPDQISLIRLYELSGDDKHPEPNIRGSIPRKTLEEFWTEYMLKNLGSNVTRDQHDRFISPANFIDQVYEIRESSLTNYMGKVTINSDPANMIAFRNTVQPYVLQNCATSACHGGEKGGAFRLVGRYGAVTIPETYTNFYIMSMYATKDGGKVINRDDPAKSLFVQYGLPRNVAQFAHPDVSGLRPRFPDENNDVYKSLVGWVRTLTFPRPNYGITYEMPTSRPASK